MVNHPANVDAHDVQMLVPLDDRDMGGELKPTVNGRDLHEFLQVGKDFSTWIKDRIEKYEFVEDQDYAVISHSPKPGSGNRGAKMDYFLSLDMGKEISMVERNDKGRQARKYFIECERRLKQPPQLNDPQFLRDLLSNYTEKVISLEKKVDELAPRSDALARIADSDGSLCITDAAKSLQMRPRDLFSYLRQNGWIYRRAGTASDIAYQSRIVSGVLEHKITTVYRSDGTERTVTQVRMTPKGLSKLALAFPRETELI